MTQTRKQKIESLILRKKGKNKIKIYKLKLEFFRRVKNWTEFRRQSNDLFRKFPDRRERTMSNAHRVRKRKRLDCGDVFLELRRKNSLSLFDYRNSKSESISK